MSLQGTHASAATGLRQLVEVTDLGGLSASPDGRKLVFRTERANIERNSYDLRWYSLDVATGQVLDIGSGGDPVYADPGVLEAAKPIWLPGGKEIAFPALVDGAIGVWKAAVDGSLSAPLIVRDEDVEDLSLSSDGRALTYKVGPSRALIERSEKSEYDRGILVDGSTDLAQDLYRGGSINGRMASQRLVGFWYVRSGLLWRSPRQLRRFDLASGEDRAVGEPQKVPPFEPPAISSVASARSGAGDVAEARWDGESGSITATLATSDRPVRCTAPLCSGGRVSALAWRAGSHQLLITFRDRHRRHSLHLWDVASGELREVASNDGLLSGDRRGLVPCAVTATDAFCIAAGAASPPRLERIDLESGSRTVLFDPNAGFWRGNQPRVEHLSWRTGKGLEVAGTLLLPHRAAARPAPLFINYYYCDGFLRGGEGDEWPLWSLLENGFVVACINAVPLKGPQDGIANYRTGLQAIQSLASLLEARQLIDKHKIGMGGFSFGSEVAMWTAVHSDLLAAVSIASAQGEASKYWMDSLPGSERAKVVRSVWGLGRPEETPAQWKLVSPSLNTDSINVPILFQLPEQEARMMPELYARLGLAAVPTELYAFPDEAHIKVQPRHRLAAYQRNLDWFRYWLQDYRDPHPKKADQYRRWDELGSRWSKAESAAPGPKP